jgi:gas vesicle protein
MSDNNSDLGAFLAGFVIGGLVGAATALILAPQSGEEIRNQIASKSRELRESGEQRVREYRQMADSYTQDYRDRAGKVITDTRGRVEEIGGYVQDQARIVLDSGKDRVSKVKGQVDAKSPTEDEQVNDPSGDGTAVA